MAHTPAPWKTRWHHGLRTAVIEAGGERIARDIPNRDADLIAAAPELLAVCQRLLAWQSEDDPYACDDWMELATDLGAQAGRAIAKAEGRTE
jgi:hypothetical protein